METAVLELIDLKKNIKKHKIIKGINLSLTSSEVFGFLGPNGAGKTTTIRMIAGLIKPTSGSVRICGYSVEKDFVKAMTNIGAIIESPEMYKFMSGMDNLIHFASMAKKPVTKERINEVVELVGLQNRIGDKVGTYSLGMRQRLGLAQAILTKPKLLILDEPANGLDPAGINELRKLIRHLAQEEGMTVFISSHLLSEIQLMCDRFAIIRQGEIIRVGNVKDVIKTNYILWQVSDPIRALAVIKDFFGIEASKGEGNQIYASVDDSVLEKINQKLILAGVNIRRVSSVEQNLEELFLNLTEGDEIV